MKRLLHAACALVALAAAAAEFSSPLSARAQGQQPAQAESAEPGVDKLFAQFDKKDSPGCALAVIHNGRVVYKRGYGVADLEHDVPMTPQSVPYTGSTANQFAAASVALLAQQGKLSPDDDVRKYVPELRDYQPPVTLRHIIHHTSGLRDA